MLDSARHYQSPEFIERFIDWMALHKLNVLHWHLTDDQGWRLEIKKYPRAHRGRRLARAGGPAAAADIDPATGKPRLYGGFYSQDDVRESSRTPRPQRHDRPGDRHARACEGGDRRLSAARRRRPARPQVPADWGVYQNLFNVEDATFAFFEDVLPK